MSKSYTPSIRSHSAVSYHSRSQSAHTPGQSPMKVGSKQANVVLQTNSSRDISPIQNKSIEISESPMRPNFGKKEPVSYSVDQQKMIDHHMREEEYSDEDEEMED